MSFTFLLSCLRRAKISLSRSSPVISPPTLLLKADKFFAALSKSVAGASPVVCFVSVFLPRLVSVASGSPKRSGLALRAFPITCLSAD